MRVWVIYERPSDYPNNWVVRWQEAIVGENIGLHDTVYGPETVCDSLAEARAIIPPGLALIARHPSDDPCIAETWL